MRKLFLLLTLIVSTTMFSQSTPLEVVAYKYAEPDESLADNVWIPAKGDIVVYDYFLSIIIGDNINDVLTVTSETHEDIVDGVKSLSFEALSQYGTEPLFISFLESQIMLIMFPDNSVIAIKYKYLNI